MTKIVAGAVIHAGECGEDDLTAANLEQMANTLEQRPPTDDDRRELVARLRWLTRLAREIDESTPKSSTESVPADEPAPE